MVCTDCNHSLPDGTAYASPLCPGCRLTQALLALISPHDRVLDIGAGLGCYAPKVYQRLHSEKPDGRYTAVDAHALYLASRRFPKDVVQVVGVAPECLSLFRDDAFSLSMAIDMPEHLVAADATRLLEQQQRLARRVIWFVPEGSHPQTHDPYRQGADHWQTHRSTWTLEQDVLVARDQAGGEARFTPSLGMVTRWPEFHAFEYLAGKTISSTGAILAVFDRA